MLRILFSVLLILALGAGLAYLADYPAEIVLLLPHWRIGFSPVTAAAALLALLLLIGLIFAAVKMLLAPLSWPQQWRRRKKTLGFNALTDGLLAVFAEDSQAAAVHAAAAQKALPAEKEPLTALLTALADKAAGSRAQFFALAAECGANPPNAAAETEDAAEAVLPALRQLLAPADKATTETRLTALKILYDAAIAAHSQQQAADYAAAAAAAEPSLIWASFAVLAAQCEAGQWEAALALYENFARAWHKTAKKDKSGAMRAGLDYYRQVLLCGQARAVFPQHPHQGRQIALQAYKLNPHFVPAAALAAQILFQLHEQRKAEKLLLAQWRLAPHPDLGRVYTRGGGTIHKTAQHLQRARELAALRPDCATAQRLLAQAAYAAQDYAEARQQAEKAQAQAPTAQGFALLAEIAQTQGDTAASAALLAKALTAPSEKAWVADGKRLKSWQPLAPQSRRLGACLWQIPAAAPALTEADLRLFLPQTDEPDAASPPLKQTKPAAAAAEKPAAPLHGYAPQRPHNTAENRPGSLYLNVDNPGIDQDSEDKTGR